MQEKQIRVAIADDNTDFVAILYEYLSAKEGIEVVGTARNGLEAVDIIKETEPDVVILDIVMPLLDGLGVLQRINGLKLRNKPQFIVLSAMGQYKITQIALSLGAEFFIVKPFDMHELVSRIRQLQKLKNQHEIRNVNLPNDAKSKPDEKDSEQKITQILNDIGVPVNLKGYRYLMSAIKMVSEDLTAINSITKLIYPDLAVKYNTTAARVERAIRNAIEITWSRGNLRSINTMFGGAMDEGKLRPSNSEFIIMSAKKLWENSPKINA